MNAKEHARKMLVKRNHPDHYLTATPKVAVEKPKKVTVEEPKVLEPASETVTGEAVKPKKTASKKKVEVETDD